MKYVIIKSKEGDMFAFPEAYLFSTLDNQAVEVTDYYKERTFLILPFHNLDYIVECEDEEEYNLRVSEMNDE